MSSGSPPDDIREEHGFADSDGVRIHYVARGRNGPLLVTVHGFPDFWFTWRHQMPALAVDHRLIAMDLRGYNLSDRGLVVLNLPHPLRLLRELAINPKQVRISR